MYNGSNASLVDTTKTYSIESMVSNQYSTITVNANGIVLSPAQTTYNGVAIGSKEKIRPNRFNTLSCTNNGMTHTIDISAVSEECYIYAGAYYLNSKNYFVFGLSKTKANANAQGNILAGTEFGVAPTSNITQIILE